MLLYTIAMANSAVPTSYDALLTLYESQQAQMLHLQDFMQTLLEQIRLSRHQHFGARSEAFNIDQLSLLNQENNSQNPYTQCRDSDHAVH
ncbi:MAG: transposase [Pseudomonadota bacterium]